MGEFYSSTAACNMGSNESWNNWIGIQVFEPAAHQVREYLEGSDAIRLPIRDTRVLLTRTWEMPLEDVAITILCAILITVLSVIFDKLIFQQIAKLLKLRSIDFNRFS